MSFKSPPEVAKAGVQVGAQKAGLSWDKAVVAGFLAGAYIAFAGMLAVVTSAGMDPQVWGGVQTLVTGGVFTLGLVLVVVAGSELLTGNMALVPLAALGRRVRLSQLVHNLSFVLIGNLLGSLFVAYFLAKETGVITAQAPLERLGEIATAKGLTESDWQIFLRAVGCNWLVCLAVWMALSAEDVAGKVLAIFFPIMAFVAMGFDHVVANMFFLPAAIFADVPGVDWGHALENWAFAFLGNFVGAGVFVATSYWYLYVKPEQGEASGGGTRAEGDGHGDGRVARDERTTASSSATA
ncbi:formate/nitrite transporter family protein [Conexibacter sp. SYSU D00693]|uniref:formate/nitrite transporter family protein n=1 Tax=Conexibacter sp. SYSU D00693 TaxID=2812560 RepID=UPI00196A9D82|nr:formate/nitrite transporter family protein [Conexibacter sp. SYSU D00693]